MQVLVGVERDGVRHDHLLQRAVVDALVGRARQHGVGDGGADALRPTGHEHVGGHADRAGRVDHVVHDQHVAAFDVADGGHLAHDIGLGALLVRNDDRCAEVFGIGVRTLGAAHVGRGDREVLDPQALDIGDEDAAGVEGVHRNVEETLYLVGVQVHRHDAVHARGHEQVGHQFGADRHAGPVLAVLARPAEVGHHGHDFVGRGAACGVDHHQQLHEVVRGREGRLDDEDRAAADRLVVGGLELAVAETQHLRLSEGRAEARGDFLGQVFRTAARKDLDFVDSHLCDGLFDVANIRQCAEKTAPRGRVFSTFG